MTPDSVLVEEALRGKRESFDALMRRHRRQLAAYLLACGCPRSDLDDFLQEAFMRAFMDLNRYHADERFGAWLAGIARNAFRDSSRRERVQKRILSLLPARWQEPAHPPFEAAEERSQAIEKSFQSLPVSFRSVLVLRYLQKLGIDEIARVERISPAAVKMRLLRARKYLQARLAPWQPSVSRESDP